MTSALNQKNMIDSLNVRQELNNSSKSDLNDRKKRFCFNSKLVLKDLYYTLKASCLIFNPNHPDCCFAYLVSVAIVLIVVGIVLAIVICLTLRNSNSKSLSNLRNSSEIKKALPSISLVNSNSTQFEYLVTKVNETLNKITKQRYKQKTI